MEFFQHVGREAVVVSTFSQSKLVVDCSELFDEMLFSDFKQLGVRLQIPVFA